MKYKSPVARMTDEPDAWKFMAEVIVFHAKDSGLLAAFFELLEAPPHDPAPRLAWVAEVVVGSAAVPMQDTCILSGLRHQETQLTGAVTAPVWIVPRPRDAGLLLESKPPALRA